MQSYMAGGFEIKPLTMVGPYNRQRFRQFSPEDSANWVMVQGKNTKRPNSMYPAMGRAHINYSGLNVLIFGTQPRAIFKSISYSYVVVGNAIYRIDEIYNQVEITNGKVTSLSGNMYFSYLVVNTIVFSCFVDNSHIYIYREDTDTFSVVTDPNSPGVFMQDGKLTKPGYIATFGNRIVVSVANSSQFFLSQINLGGSAFDANTCFTTAGAAVFAQEDGIIRQMGVLNNTLYIFCDFITGVWSNITSVFAPTNVAFPWKHNTTYNWNFGIAASNTLDIDFGYLVFLAQNSDGLLQFMVSDGGYPTKISTEAIDVLLQNYTNNFGSNNPFTTQNTNGFLYQYENLIFYRVSGGAYVDYGILDQEQNANSLEYKFDTESWSRCIELNGNRNRIVQHIYFNDKHLVTVYGENTVYEMSGRFYYNEVRNTSLIDPQQPGAYVPYPFRYERVSPIISEGDYSEFETEYVEIDFVFGDSNINFSEAPFQNAQFLIDEQLLGTEVQYIIDEQPGSDGQPVFIIGEQGNTPGITDVTYNYLFNPHIELFFSDDGGISYNSADVREFSQMGVYIWKMRWYQLGPSRNRVYKLVCVSAVPIVILGSVMNIRRMSGGSN